MKKWLYKLQSWFFTFLGDIGWAGIRHPFWLVFNIQFCKLKGEHYVSLKPMLEPGDILIRRFEGYLDRFFIPGWWNHGGVYVGGEGEKVIHSISDGVVIEHVINFMRCDHLIVLRPPKKLVKAGIRKAFNVIGREYDFNFDFSNHESFSCTELVDYCYPNLVVPKKRFGRKTIVADDIVACDKLKVVWDSRDSAFESMEVIVPRK